ncbi:type I restriction-modification enzyme R subunit C-terminal domain-containing protein [Leptothoe spongobia]|uniref:EcoEI R protein C-terminal domain-containing protein n=1 Tax=Leptothoe spongobia TAU-MAC 1115 TaxID=1967444 RepID=A0A947GKR4_9CYAN|nr:type I restriction-modification enzyme R subunit C-terminal domain-containing protein [Leptothoe spongobia]MBT9316722.1 hypothetical protein [Leptothoe spongobia TAU-MAC 1115]
MVLAYIAYTTAPISRQKRVADKRVRIISQYSDKQQEFLDFVLDQYLKEGVGELDRGKLPQLLELKYSAIRDAVAELGSVGENSQVFVDFQQYLYEQDQLA